MRLSWYATFLVLVAATGLSSCSYKDVNRKKHETGDSPQKEQENVTTISKRQKRLENLDVGALRKTLSKGKQQHLRAVIKKTKPFVLNSHYVNAPQLKVHERMPEVVTLFSEALLRLEKKDAKTGDNLFKRYLERVTESCQNTQYTCHPFSSSPYSSKLLLLRAEKISQQIPPLKDTSTAKICKNRSSTHKLVKTYYKYLGQAYGLKNRRRDSDLKFKYIRHAQRLQNAIDCSPNGLPEHMRKTHLKVFSTIVKNFNPEDYSEQKICSFINTFDPFSYSLREKNTFHSTAATLFKWAAERCMTQNEILEAVVQTARPQKDRVGFLEATKEIRFMLKRLNLQKDVIANESDETNLDPQLKNLSFLIIDKLYNGEWGKGSAEEVWKAQSIADNPEKEFLKTLKKYLTVRTLYLVKTTQEELGKVYTDPELSSESLVEESINGSRELSSMWGEFHNRVGRLKEFIVTQFGKDVKRSQLYEDTITEMDAIKRNLKYVVVRPLMMALAYFIERREVDMTFMAYWGQPIEIDYLTIIKKIIEGSFGSWFRFGNGTKPISKVETLYAFYYALATNALEIKDPRTGSYRLRNVEFFDKVIGSYITPQRIELEQKVRNIKEEFESSSQYQTFLDRCRNPDQPVTIPFARTDHTSSTTRAHTASIADYTYLGTPNTGLVDTGFTVYNNTAKLKRLRVDLKEKMALIRSMKGILQHHIKQVPPSYKNLKKEAKKSLKEVNSLIKDIESLKRELYSVVAWRHKQVSDCLTRALKKEQQRQHRLLKLERQHLKQVYQDIQKLRKAPEKSREKIAEKINNKYNFHHNRITADGYYYTRNDLFQRIAKHLESGRFTPAVDVIKPRNMEEIEWYSSPKKPKIPFYSGPQGQKRFITDAMRYLNGKNTTRSDSTSYLNWYDTSGHISTLWNRVQTLTELYRISDSAHVKLSRPECRRENPPDDCISNNPIVTADDLVASYFEFFEIVNMNDKEADALSWLSLQRKYPIDDLKGIFLDQKNLNPKEFLDPLFSKLTDEKNPLKKSGRKFYDTHRSLGTFFIPPEKNVKCIMSKQYRPFVRQPRAKAKNFIKAVKKRQKRDTQKGQIKIFFYELNENDRPTGVTAENSQGKAVYLDPVKLRDYNARVNEFNSKTQGYFRKGGDESCH